MLPTKAFAAYDATSPLRPYAFERRAPGEHDVLIEILYCGVCHSDLHQVRNEWGGTRYPLVPGHEIVGRVARVGAKVTKFKEGDAAGVGCFVDSCRTCPSCTSGQESYCDGPLTFTYGSTDKDGTQTQGGYATQIVVDESYVLRVGHATALDTVAPLLCAGITTYSPLRHWKVGKGQRVAVMGLGGLGHMAIKLAAAMGAEVALISSSPSKKADALRLGAHEFILGSDDAALAAQKGRYDLVIDTISAKHDVQKPLGLLGVDGTLVLVGIPPEPLAVGAFPLISKRRRIAGSLIGGIAETQEMLDFCAEHRIGAEVETIPVQQINEAYERMVRSDVRYRFVIDAKSLG